LKDASYSSSRALHSLELRTKTYFVLRSTSGQLQVNRVCAIAVLIDKYACSGHILQPMLFPYRSLIEKDEKSRNPYRLSAKELLSLVLLAYTAEDKDFIWLAPCHAIINLDAAAFKAGADAHLPPITPRVIREC
jgi:hypothetical protein